MPSVFRLPTSCSGAVLDSWIGLLSSPLLGLYSLVTLLATRLVQGGALPIRQAAWYRKTLPTFSDALAAVRSHWWRAIGLSTSHRKDDIIKVPRRVFQRLHEAACYAV